MRACLDQLLIVIRLLTTLCDHSSSKPRLIVIMNLTAKLKTIYSYSAQLCWTVNCHCCRSLQHAYYYTVSQKVPTFTLSVTMSNLNREFKIFALLKNVRNLLQNPYDNIHLT